MTASAQFTADYVLTRATKRLAWVEEDRLRAREEKIASLQKIPVTVGSLWWKRNHYRTPAEAEDFYKSAWQGSWAGTPEIRTEGDHRHTKRKLTVLRDLAAAAIEGANGAFAFMTLEAPDCYVLDIPSDKGKLA